MTISYGNTNPEALLPYLNPEYWDGHSLGFGRMEDDQMPTFLSSYSIANRELRDSKKKLQARLARMAKIVPLETFEDGQVFDANEHEPDTVIIFREEELLGITKIAADDLEGLSTQELPVRPFDVSMFGGTDTWKLITKINEEGGVDAQYSTGPMWGIIAEDGKRNNRLHVVDASSVQRDGSKVNIDTILQPFPSPVNIGETKHYTSMIGERLSRVNILQIVAFGEVQRKRSGVKNLARLAFGHGRV